MSVRLINGLSSKRLMGLRAGLRAGLPVGLAVSLLAGLAVGLLVTLPITLPARALDLTSAAANTPVAAVAAASVTVAASDPVPKSITRELTSIKGDLTRYRAENTRQRDEYLVRYVDRFPPEEQANLKNQVTAALAELNALQRQVDRAEALARAGAPRKQLGAATTRAATAAAKLTERSQISFDDANQLAASRLSLGEALRAWADYSRSLARLSAISDRLTRVNSRL